MKGLYTAALALSIVLSFLAPVLFAQGVPVTGSTDTTNLGGYQGSQALPPSSAAGLGPSSVPNAGQYGPYDMALRGELYGTEQDRMYGLDQGQTYGSDEGLMYGSDLSRVYGGDYGYQSSNPYSLAMPNDVPPFEEGTSVLGSTSACMGGAGGTDSGATSSGMGSC